MTCLNHVSLQSGRAGWASSNFHICARRSLIRLMAFARLHALAPAFRESRNPTGRGGSHSHSGQAPEPPQPEKYMNQAFLHRQLAGQSFCPAPPRHTHTHTHTHTPTFSLGSGDLQTPNFSCWRGKKSLTDDHSCHPSIIHSPTHFFHSGLREHVCWAAVAAQGECIVGMGRGPGVPSGGLLQQRSLGAPSSPSFLLTSLILISCLHPATSFI